MQETKNFTLGEKEKLNTYYDVYEYIRYCSYCGNKAKRKDVGSSHGHRWEENIIYNCECESALKEVEIKNEINKLNTELRKFQYELERLQSLEDNEIVNTMKFNKELENLKKKFNIDS